jgi:hypothetical protein
VLEIIIHSVVVLKPDEYLNEDEKYEYCLNAFERWIGVIINRLFS